MNIVLSTKSKVKQLVTIFSNLKRIVDNVMLIMDTDRLYIQEMNDTHACLVEVCLKSTWFDTFECDEHEKLGVNCHLLFKIIDCWKEGQTIQFSIKKNEDNLHINFEGENTISKAFVMPLMMLEHSPVTIPERDYNVDFALKSSVFKELIAEHEIFSDNLNINCHDTHIIIEANGDSGKMQTIIKENDIEEMSIEENSKICAGYKTNYVSHVCSFSKLNDCIYIHMSLNSPLKMHYSLDDKDSFESMNYVRFYIAPVI